MADNRLRLNPSFVLTPGSFLENQGINNLERKKERWEEFYKALPEGLRLPTGDSQQATLSFGTGRNSLFWNWRMKLRTRSTDRPITYFPIGSAKIRKTFFPRGRFAGELGLFGGINKLSDRRTDTTPGLYFQGWYKTTGIFIALEENASTLRDPFLLSTGLIGKIDL